jgi:hypothetical protein
VLADFDNQTGDPVFDDALRQGLSWSFNNRRSHLISDRKVQQTLALMGQPKDARLTPESRSRSASEPQVRMFWRARSPVLAANTCWACAQGTAHRKHPRSTADPGGTAERTS